jgi:hypothetical protein
VLRRRERRPLGASEGKGWRKVASTAPEKKPALGPLLDPARVRIFFSLACTAATEHRFLPPGGGMAASEGLSTAELSSPVSVIIRCEAQLYVVVRVTIYNL